MSHTKFKTWRIRLGDNSTPLPDHKGLSKRKTYHRYTAVRKSLIQSFAGLVELMTPVLRDNASLSLTSMASIGRRETEKIFQGATGVEKDTYTIPLEYRLFAY